MFYDKYVISSLYYKILCSVTASLYTTFQLKLGKYHIYAYIATH